MRNYFSSAAVVHALAVASTVVSASGPTVNLAAGTLQGGICANNPLATYFKSIPYAQPPVGSLRFAPPKLYTQAYDGGSRDATKAAPSCIQFDPVFSEANNTSEDCLYLDIWAPANATNTSALPVRAWIYGGSNDAGGISDPLYDGCNVPDTNALMVSINYRLGPLGYLTLGPAGIAGNQGIQDILLGLQWIQDNIVAFGGDPKRVMLHGQSAGGINSFVVAALPQAPTLINSVILESGGGRDTILKDHAEATGEAFTKALNCSLTDSACLKSVSVAALKDTFTNLPLLNTQSLAAVSVDSIDNFGFIPHVDGQIIPFQPSKAGVNVPVIVGSASQDGALFALIQYADAPEGPKSATAQDYSTYLSQNFGSAASLIEQYYPLSAFNASPFPAFTAIGEALTASSYLCTVYRGANAAAARGIPVWTYLFAHSPTCNWLPGVPDKALPLLGATHTSEIPFMLNNTVHLPQPDGNCTMSSDEQTLAAFMVQAWTTFAATQRPTADPSEWPAYGGPNNTIGVTFNNTPVVGKIDFSACQLWDDIDAMQVAAANNGSYAGSGTTANGTNATVSSVLPSSTSNTASCIEVRGLTALLGLVAAGMLFL